MPADTLKYSCDLLIEPISVKFSEYFSMLMIFHTALKFLQYLHAYSLQPPLLEVVLFAKKSFKIAIQILFFFYMFDLHDCYDCLVP